MDASRDPATRRRTRLVWGSAVALLLVALLALTVAAPAFATSNVIYVDKAAVGANSGSSWENAYTDLQAALTAAVAGDQIWVAQGTYYPTSGTDRTISFPMKKDVALYGGFAGSETLLTDRDWKANPTILSGNIGLMNKSTDNSYHVILGFTQPRTPNPNHGRYTLDGFTIRDGYADGAYLAGNGGGMVNPGLRTSPFIANCLFTQNYAVEGGAIYNLSESSPLITNTQFSANSATKGGAMVNRIGSSPQLSDCDFINNRAEYRGGATLEDYASQATYAGCTFKDNSSGGLGGAVYCDDVASQYGGTYVFFDGCLFENNRADIRGGAIAAFDWGSPIVQGTTFKDNKAKKGGSAIDLVYLARLYYDNCTFESNFGGPDADIQADSEAQFGSTIYEGAEYVAQALAARSHLWENPVPPPAPVAAQPSLPDPVSTAIKVSAEQAPTYELATGTAVVYVDADSTAITPNGLSWATAFRNVQEGLDAAFALGGGQVWVAEGTYSPTSFQVPSSDGGILVPATALAPGEEQSPQLDLHPEAGGRSLRWLRGHRDGVGTTRLAGQRDHSHRGERWRGC